MSARIIEGDALARLAELPADSVHCVVTSPPYYGLRDYGVAGQLGLEATPDEYVARMVAVFREVRRVLRRDGTAWVNMGDGYATVNRGENARPRAETLSGIQVGNPHSDIATRKEVINGQKRSGIKPKDLLGMPWMLAFALRADGWWLRQDIIWCLSGGTRVYARTQKGDMPMSIKDLVRLDPATVKLWNGERWTQARGWSQTPRPDRTYEIELRSGERIGCTANHEWPVEPCGNRRTDELRVGQIIRRCRLPEPDLPRHPEALGDAEIGWLVGTFLADGSWSHDRAAFTIASNINEMERFERLRVMAERWDASYRIAWTEGNNSRPIVHSRILAAVIETYLSGENAKGKHLDVRCWRRTDDFLRNVLLGYLQGDGHYDKENQRWRVGFTQNDALAVDLRTLCGRLGYQLRLKRYDHQSQWGVFPGWRGEIRFRPSTHHNARDDGEIVAIRESRARKFWDIGVEDEPHLFALASGILTHNSKPNPMPESVTDRCTKSHEYLLLLSKSATYFYDAEAIAEAADRRGEIPGASKKHTSSLVNDGRIRQGLESHSQTPVATTRNRRSVWTIATEAFPEAHFATYPTALVEPCILAGTSQKGVCPSCGAPWRRVVERGHLISVDGTKATYRPTKNADDDRVKGRSEGWTPNHRRETETTGWSPTCRCDAGDPVPATVLDPFLGAGTTALVADRLGRNSIGIELNPAYAEMARRRIADDAGMFASPYDPEADAIASYNEAVREVGKRVKAGAPVPDFFLSDRAAE